MIWTSAATSSVLRCIIRRVVGPDDVTALAVHIMTGSALTGTTYDIGGGQQLAPGV
jgi:hypothetical protein